MYFFNPFVPNAPFLYPLKASKLYNKKIIHKMENENYTQNVVEKLFSDPFLKSVN